MKRLFLAVVVSGFLMGAARLRKMQVPTASFT